MTSCLNTTIPDLTIITINGDTKESYSTRRLFDSKRVLLLGMPGAFTPICTNIHLPKFIENAAKLKEEKQIDTIACLCVCDPFVVHHWSNSLGNTGQILMIADWNAALCSALGLTTDLSVAGMGMRSTRFALLAENSIITKLWQEESPGTCDVSAYQQIGLSL